jgi:hypothetical protein
VGKRDVAIDEPGGEGTLKRVHNRELLGLNFYVCPCVCVWWCAHICLCGALVCVTVCVWLRARVCPCVCVIV